MHLTLKRFELCVKGWVGLECIMRRRNSCRTGSTKVWRWEISVYWEGQ